MTFTKDEVDEIIIALESRSAFLTRIIFSTRNKKAIARMKEEKRIVDDLIKRLKDGTTHSHI